MKVLVTGANGFLGKFVTKKLAENGHAVFATDAHSSPSRHLITQSDYTNYFSVDLIRSFHQIIPLIFEVDAVVHLAAIVGIQNQIAPAFKMYETNVVVAGKIIRVCSDLDKYFIFSSTSEIFGKNPKSPWDEYSESKFGRTFENRWAYGMGKALIEELIFGMAESEALRAASIRLFNLYGPGQGETYLIPRWIKSAIEEKPIEIYGSGNQEFSFTFVEDAAQFITNLVESKLTGPINFGSPERTSLWQLSEELKRFFPDLKLLTGLANRQGEMSEYSRIPKSSRLDEKSKLLTFTPLSEGLRKTIEFQSKNPTY